MPHFRLPVPQKRPNGLPHTGIGYRKTPLCGVLPVAKLRLLIVEDNALLREGMAALLNQRSDFTVVASGDSSFDIQKARQINPDVVLVDLGLRNQHSLHVVETVKRASPAARVIL